MKPAKPKTVGDLCNLLERRPGMTCTEIGEELWPSMRGNRAAMARSAGALAARAMRAGRVKVTCDPKTMRRRFYLTNAEIQDRSLAADGKEPA